MTINGKPTTHHGDMRIDSRVSHTILNLIGTVTALDLHCYRSSLYQPAPDTLVLWDRGFLGSICKSYIDLIV